jgi:hypothetical protein
VDENDRGGGSCRLRCTPGAHAERRGADSTLPAGVDLADGVTEDEAVAASLWNNAALSADLGSLGLARANLIKAGLIENPSLQMLLPVGAKPFELAISWPIEQLWQRPMAIPGVANVAIWGQRDRQLQVLVDPERLRVHGVTLDDVLRAVRDAVLPAAGGFVETPNQRLAVTHQASVGSAADLSQVPVVFRSNAPLTLGQVAEVREEFMPKFKEYDFLMHWVEKPGSSRRRR